ncbi:unnamed protein product [Acanthosepion pharaonis]|uniref:Uncharacterized protein n=1 Tax=Acanthosepion pharaonis TaxID=158019 RepID=A0A812DP51_ACAPH|nr:unnamed protein product [Sepia pharaonis]
MGYKWGLVEKNISGDGSHTTLILFLALFLSFSLSLTHISHHSLLFSPFFSPTYLHIYTALSFSVSLPHSHTLSLTIYLMNTLIHYAIVLFLSPSHALYFHSLSYSFYFLSLSLSQTQYSLNPVLTLFLFLSLPLSLSRTHTHTHTHIYTIPLCSFSILSSLLCLCSSSRFSPSFYLLSFFLIVSACDLKLFCLFSVPTLSIFLSIVPVSSLSLWRVQQKPTRVTGLHLPL